MLNKLSAFCAAHDLLEKGDRIVCAVSGGADSMALLWAMYLLKDSYELELSAAHFNHGLRGQESDEDARFVQRFCDRYDIPFCLGSGEVTAGTKGLEAAARDARYRFLQSLPGKIATAHTANDNAETVLMHLVRGTGLKGLGGIAPQRGSLIRPMLSVTREEVLSFLEEYHIPYRTDSSNHSDAFLRNRLRHHVMPLLTKENPSLAQNLSAMALRLRQDEQLISQTVPKTNSISQLRQLPPALRSRALAEFLEENGVKEPATEHLALAQSLVFSENPSAAGDFPNGVRIVRNYDRLQRCDRADRSLCLELTCPGTVVVDAIQITCEETDEAHFQTDCFTVKPQGKLTVRSRKPGDSMRLQGGTKKLKELLIDRKIPAHLRDRIPVIADELGVLGVYGIGANLDRISQEGIVIRFVKR